MESTEGLRRTAVRSTAWTVAGYGASLVLRLASSVVLTRLLVPGVYGLTTIVTTYAVGLALLTDVGLSASIMQHARGRDPVFLDTAWTIQVVRGVSLFGAACALAWPVAALNRAPQLSTLLPVLGLQMLVSGLGSARLLTVNRSLQLGRLTLLDTGTQALGMGVTIAWASRWPSATAIVVGGLAGALARTALSHLVLPGARSRLAWDAEARRELLRFGRWIFVAALFTFAFVQGDRLVLSTFVDLDTLGIYGTAVQLATVTSSLVVTLSSKVLFPLCARLVRQGEGGVRGKLLRLRRLLLAGLLPVAAALAVWGDLVVGVLYPPAYAGAGWMLRLLSVAAVFEIIGQTMSPVILARGDSFRHMIVVVARGSLLIVLMVAGAALGGVQGLILGLVVAAAASYPIIVWGVRGSGTWTPGLDLAALAYAAAVALVCFLGRPLAARLAGSLSELAQLARHALHP